MTLGERMIVAEIAWGIRHLHGGHLVKFRADFDKRFAERPEEWRRDIWRKAAERAERMVSR